MATESVPSPTNRPYLPYSQALAVALITLGFVYLCVLIMRPFLNVLAWALAMGVALHPFSTSLRRKIRHQSLVASIAVLIGALALGLPAFWVAKVLIESSIENLSALINQSGVTTWIDPSTAPSRLIPLLEWLERSFHFQAVLENFVKSSTEYLPNILTMSLAGIVQFALVLFTTFFFVRDDKAFFQYLIWISPLTPQETTAVALRAVDTLHACLYGIVLMAILQGSLGAFIFWWLQLPQPLLWGVVMGLLAIVPYLGAFIIWIPTAVVLAMHGSWTDAIILSVWGGIVIGLADNFLYPVLVGKRLHYHPLLIFLFLLGGVIVFGASGVVLGPLVLSVTHTILAVWQRDGDGAKPYEHAILPPAPSGPLEPPEREPLSPS